MSAAIIFILFAVTGDNAPDLVGLATYDSRPNCEAAMAKVQDALNAGQDGKHLICISSDSLDELGHKNGISGN